MAMGPTSTKKTFLLLAFVGINLLALKPANMAYSASFPSRQVAFSTC